MAKWNWGGALGGAAAGAGAGSAGGPVGMGLGGLLGLLGGGFSGMGGTKDKMKKLPTMTPQQQGILNNLLSQLGGGGQLGQGYGQAMSGLSDYLDTSSQAYEKFADPYMRQFEQQTVPQLAERFAGANPMGGALSSSGFGQALSAASGNLQSELAAMKTGLQRQAINDMMQQYQSMLGMGLGAQPFAYMYQPGGAGVGQSAFSQYAGAGFPGVSNFGNWWQNQGPLIGNV